MKANSIQSSGLFLKLAFVLGALQLCRHFCVHFGTSTEFLIEVLGVLPDDDCPHCFVLSVVQLIIVFALKHSRRVHVNQGGGKARKLWLLTSLILPHNLCSTTSLIPSTAQKFLHKYVKTTKDAILCSGTYTHAIISHVQGHIAARCIQ